MRHHKWNKWNHYHYATILNNCTSKKKKYLRSKKKQIFSNKGVSLVLSLMLWFFIYLIFILICFESLLFLIQTRCHFGWLFLIYLSWEHGVADIYTVDKLPYDVIARDIQCPVRCAPMVHHHRDNDFFFQTFNAYMLMCT